MDMREKAKKNYNQIANQAKN